MSNAPIARVKDDAGPAAQFLRQRKRGKPGGECHWRGIGLEPDAFLRNPDIAQSPRLIVAQHFEGVDAAPPEVGETEQPTKKESAASALGDEALRMEVHDAIDQPLPQQRG